MAAILASQGCYCSIGELRNHRRLGDNLSFSRSLTNYNNSESENDAKNLVRIRTLHRFRVAMQGRELPETLDTKGRVVKMVPTTEIKKRLSQSISTSKIINGSPKNINGVEINVVKGGSLVKRDPTPPVSISSRPVKELPPVEGLEVLISDDSFSWANENYSSVQRTIDVWSSVISLRLRVLLDNAKWTYFRGFSEDKQGERRRKTASWLRDRMLQLGPTFIKLGQLCSTRSDIFPKEIVDELGKLQDKAPAFSPSKAKSLIEMELGAPVHLLFKEFEDLPIAAASLGQVHRAVLHNGEKVVVKVQRPGLKKLFDIDLRNCSYYLTVDKRVKYNIPPMKWIMGIYSLDIF